MFHTAIAERRGLSAVESKVVDYLSRLGPMTPKDLAGYSGLAPASVTALIDRLERKGVVRRVPHPDDRRRVLIEFERASEQSSAGFWTYLVESSVKLCEDYSDEQLRTVVEFLGAAAAVTHESTARLTDPTKE